MLHELHVEQMFIQASWSWWILHSNQIHFTWKIDALFGLCRLFFLHWPARKLFWLTATTFQCNENYSIPTGQKLFNELNWVMKTGAIYYIHVPGLPTSVTPSSKFTDTPYSMQRRKMCEPVRGNTIYSVSSRYSSCNTMFDCTMV